MTSVEAAHVEHEHKHPSDFFYFGPEGQESGLHPEREDYGSFVAFSDPDDNSWLVQERRSA